MSSSVFALAALGCVLVFLSVVMAYLAPHIFTLPPEIKSDAFWCILIVGCTSALQFTFFPFAAVFTAKQRFDLANLIGVCTRLLTAGSVFFALRSGYGLIGVSAATCGVSLIDYLIRWHVARIIAPGIEISWNLATLSRLKEIASFGTWNFQISISSYAELHLQTLLISLMMPIAAAGHYALATGLVFQIVAVLGPIGQVMYPAAAELHARNEQGALNRLYIDGSRLVMLVTVVVVLIAAFWAEDFYRLWIGAQYLTGDPFPSVATLLRILLIAIFFSYSSNVAGQILLGTGRIRLLSMSLLCGSALNLILLLILIRPFGLIGVAAAAAITAFAINLNLLPRVVFKATGFKVGDLMGALLRPIGVGAGLSLVFFGIRLAGPPQDWAHLILQGVFAGTSAAILIFAIGITTVERERFVFTPIRRLLKSANANASAGAP